MAVDRLCDAGQYEKRRFVDIPQWIIYTKRRFSYHYFHTKNTKIFW